MRAEWSGADRDMIISLLIAAGKIKDADNWITEQSLSRRDSQCAECGLLREVWKAAVTLTLWPRWYQDRFPVDTKACGAQRWILNDGKAEVPTKLPATHLSCFQEHVLGSILSLFTNKTKRYNVCLEATAHSFLWLEAKQEVQTRYMSTCFNTGVRWGISLSNKSITHTVILCSGFSRLWLWVDESSFNQTWTTVSELNSGPTQTQAERMLQHGWLRTNVSWRRRWRWECCGAEIWSNCYYKQGPLFLYWRAVNAVDNTSSLLYLTHSSMPLTTSGLLLRPTATFSSTWVHADRPSSSYCECDHIVLH